MRHGEVLGRSSSTLRNLRPFVFLESGDRTCFDPVSSQLEALDYTVQSMVVAYYDPNNFRGNSADSLEGRHTYTMLAIPSERNVG
jgi:hypothetical protein